MATAATATASLSQRRELRVVVIEQGYGTAAAEVQQNQLLAGIDEQ
jgi:hypothetical protein